MAERPKTEPMPRRELQGWISLAIVAGAGIVGSLMSYDRGQAVADAHLRQIDRQLAALERRLDACERLAERTARIEGQLGAGSAR